MRVLLVCNYSADRQQSMLRFGELLRAQWQARGVEISALAPLQSGVARHWAKSARLAKWFGYVDKYIFFPPQLSRWLHADAEQRNGAPTIVHVIDHSNAVYVPHAARLKLPWVVTCHDLLAVRGAMGEDTGCPASPLGRQLQRAIVRGLSRASAIVADSTSTRHDLDRIVSSGAKQLRSVIPLALNHPYRCITENEARMRLGKLSGVPWAAPFLLHVGSNETRKNREGVMRVFARLAPHWPGNLVLCGAGLTPRLQAIAAVAGVANRVFTVSGADNPQLEAVYNLAHALLFPSICEGFGWPVIEAQACGCPVVCSDRTSLPEVGGEAVLVHALEDEAGMADSVARLREPAFRAGVIARGRANLKRFSTDRMMDAYGETYEQVLATFAGRGWRQGPQLVYK